MIKEDDFSEDQRKLYETMSDISEDCYCAGWMMGLEYSLWNVLQDGGHRLQGGGHRYGMGEIDVQQLEKCRELARDLDGWILWVDDDTDPGLPISEWGPRFVSMSDWLPKVTAHAMETANRAELPANCAAVRPPGMPS